MNNGLWDAHIIAYGGGDPETGSESGLPDETQSHHRILAEGRQREVCRCWPLNSGSHSEMAHSLSELYLQPAGSNSKIPQCPS